MVDFEFNGKVTANLIAVLPVTRTPIRYLQVSVLSTKLHAPACWAD